MCALSILNIAYEERVWTLRLGLKLLAGFIDVCGTLATALGRLLFEEAVYGVELGVLASIMF